MGLSASTTVLPLAPAPDAQQLVRASQEGPLRTAHLMLTNLKQVGAGAGARAGSTWVQVWAWARGWCGGVGAGRAWGGGGGVEVVCGCGREAAPPQLACTCCLDPLPQPVRQPCPAHALCSSLAGAGWPHLLGSMGRREHGGSIPQPVRPPCPAHALSLRASCPHLLRVSTNAAILPLPSWSTTPPPIPPPTPPCSTHVCLFTLLLYLSTLRLCQCTR